MNATPVLAGVLVVAFGLAGYAKLAAVPAMRARAEHVGYGIDSLPPDRGAWRSWASWASSSEPRSR